MLTESHRAPGSIGVAFTKFKIIQIRYVLFSKVLEMEHGMLTEMCGAAGWVLPRTPKECRIGGGHTQHWGPDLLDGGWN